MISDLFHRQGNNERGAACRALHLNVTLVFSSHSLANSQSEPGAIFFGGEEGGEEVGEIFRFDAGAGVADLYDELLPAILSGLNGGQNGQFAIFAYRLHAI